MIFVIQNESAAGLMHSLLDKMKKIGDYVLPKYAIVLNNKKKKEENSVKDISTRLNKNVEKERAANELIGLYNKSKKGEEFLKDYVHGLEEMMFMTHHKVRQPVANILGMAGLIDEYANSPEELKKIARYMKQSALDLDAFTRELTTFISDLEKKGKDR